MKFILVLFLSLILFSADFVFAFPIRSESGVVYICSTPSGEIKMTADLISNPGEKLATVVEIGSKEVIRERVGKVQRHSFILRPSKTSLLEIRRIKAKAPILSLNIDPKNTRSMVVQDQEGVKIVKLDAFLDAPTLDLHNEPVNCLETTWQ